MTISSNEYNYQYVAPGGQIVLTAIFETYADSGAELGVSGVQVTITPVGSTIPVAGPTSAVISVDQATYTYTWNPAASVPPGDYVAVWAGTGPGGALVITQGLTVTQAPSETTSPGGYCTIAQYRAWAMDELTPDDLITMYARRAAEIIDNAAVGAVYPVDVDSMPTVPAHIDLFMRATAAQIQFMIGNGDPANIKPQYSSTSMGGVSQTRAAAAQGGILPRLAPAAAQIFHTGGLLGTAPLSGW